MYTKAVVGAIGKVFLQQLYCLLPICLLTPHSNSTTGSTDKPPPHLLGEATTSLVRRVILYKLLQCSPVAFAAMVGTFQLLDRIPPSRHTFKKRRMHRAVSVSYKTGVPDPVDLLCLLESFQNNISFHFGGRASPVLVTPMFLLGHILRTGLTVLVAYTKVQQLSCLLAKNHSHSRFSIVRMLMRSLAPPTIYNHRDSRHPLVVVSPLLRQPLLLLPSFHHRLLEHLLPPVANRLFSSDETSFGHHRHTHWSIRLLEPAMPPTCIHLPYHRSQIDRPHSFSVRPRHSV